MTKKIAILSLFTSLIASQVAQASFEELETLKTVNGHPLARLEEAKASITYRWHEALFGNVLEVAKGGELRVNMGRPRQELEPQIKPLYDFLNSEIKAGFKLGALEVTSKTIQNGAAHFKGTRHIKTTSDLFTGNQTLLGSEGSIELTAKKFNFSTSFIDVKEGTTTIVFKPHQDIAYKPIKSIVVTPKVSPVFIQGTLDFEKLTIHDFIVSHSDIVVNFKN
jgi:hypothetical protein